MAIYEYEVGKGWVNTSKQEQVTPEIDPEEVLDEIFGNEDLGLGNLEDTEF